MDKMTDTLILHIGLPKCGSTTLQKKVFNQFDNTVTGYSNEEWKLNLFNKLFRLFYARNSSVWNQDEGKEFLKLLKAACQKTSGNPLLISHEGFSMYVGGPPIFCFDDLSDDPHWAQGSSDKPNGSIKQFLDNEKALRYEYFPISYHLTELLKACPWISKIKIILSIRNQTEWLASWYAHCSDPYRERASKEDFTKRIRQMMLDDSLYGGGSLNWGKIVHDLSRVVGKTNVYVLLLEETGTYSYWKTLAEGSELQIDPEFLLSKNNERENVGKINSQTWILKNRANFIINSQGHRYLRQFLKCKEGQNILKNPLLFNIALKALRPVEIIAMKLVEMFGSKKELRLDDDDLKADIQAYCKPFNQELADWLGRDFSELSELGY